MGGGIHGIYTSFPLHPFKKKATSIEKYAEVFFLLLIIDDFSNFTAFFMTVKLEKVCMISLPHGLPTSFSSAPALLTV